MQKMVFQDFLPLRGRILRIKNMKENNQKGQSTIEFILSFSVTISFIFLFLQMAINYTNGYLIHHATFMASRAYLTADSEQKNPVDGDNNAVTLARIIFNRYLPSFLRPNDINKLKINGPNTDKKAFVGLYYEFSQIFSLSLIGGRENMDFRSESFLGREPTRPETYEQVCKRMKSLISASMCEFHMTLEDNGG
jgi:hypothetical protein